MPANEMTLQKIFLIDDDADDCIIFQEVVRKISPSIQVDYITEVKGLQSKGNCILPDLLFLDINMPDRDGFEWLRYIQENGYNIPVVMYSTASNAAFVEKAYKSGAHVYFPKPNSLEVLTRSLQQLFCFNWKEPEKIQANFFQNGQYKVFEPDLNANIS